MSDNRPIGVLDSGMGGVSVLCSLMNRLPREKFIYWGDNGNAPYGVKSEKEILSLTWSIANKLLDRGVKAIVIACNTATAAAANDLRSSNLDIPVLGLEPALKPAEEYSGDRRVIVLATEATLTLPKYEKLLSRYGRNTVNIPSPELVEFVERGDTDSNALIDCLRGKFSGYDDIAAVVLGCTHYVWLKGAIRKVLPNVRIFDGNEGLSRHLYNVLSEKGLLSDSDEGGYELNTTSRDDNTLVRMKELLLKGVDIDER